jgi:hypothetical protein
VRNSGNEGTADSANMRPASFNLNKLQDHPMSLLARTLRFVRAHPALAETLRAYDLGASPAIVEKVMGHVFSTGWRG